MKSESAIREQPWQPQVEIIKVIAPSHLKYSPKSNLELRKRKVFMRREFSSDVSSTMKLRLAANLAYQ